MATTVVNAGPKTVTGAEIASLRDALRTRDGEKAPRVEVKKEGRNLSCEDLEKMGVEDLLRCDILLFGKALRFFDPDLDDSDRIAFRKKYNIPTNYNASWVGALSNFWGNESAIQALQDMYKLVLSFASGGI